MVSKCFRKLVLVERWEIGVNEVIARVFMGYVGIENYGRGSIKDGGDYR